MFFFFAWWGFDFIVEGARSGLKLIRIFRVWRVCSIPLPVEMPLWTRLLKVWSIVTRLPLPCTKLWCGLNLGRSRFDTKLIHSIFISPLLPLVWSKMFQFSLWLQCHSFVRVLLGLPFPQCSLGTVFMRALSARSLIGFVLFAMVWGLLPRPCPWHRLGWAVSLVDCWFRYFAPFSGRRSLGAYWGWRGGHLLCPVGVYAFLYLATCGVICFASWDVDTWCASLGRFFGGQFGGFFCPFWGYLASSRSAGGTSGFGFAAFCDSVFSLVAFTPLVVNSLLDSWPATPLAMFPVSHLWHETNVREGGCQKNCVCDGFFGIGFYRQGSLNYTCGGN